MRASPWLVGSSGTALLAIAVLAACSSTSAPPVEQDASTVDAGCYVDASLSGFAASDAAGADCAACVQSHCQPAIVTCSSDCTCINFFGCVADAGTVSTGISVATMNAAAACAGNSPGMLLLDPGLNALLTCFQGPCQSICSPEAGAGDEAAAPTDDAGADATTAGDAAADEAGALDAAADAPVTDAAATDAATDAHADGG